MLKQVTSVKNLVKKLIVYGNIKIGGKGKEITSSKGNNFKPPTRLDYFKLTTTERGEDGNFIEDTVLTEKIKEDCLLNSAGNIVGIPISFMWDSIDLIFPHRRAKYVGATLECTGDGETARWKMDDFKEPRPGGCPCKDPSGCKLHGKLTCIVEANPLYGQVHKFTTTGKNSVEGIVAGLEVISKATGGKLAGAPLMLTFQNVSTLTPNGAPTTIGVVGVSFRGSFADMRRNAIERIEADKRFGDDMKLLEESAITLGEGDYFDVNDDEKDFTDEFHPDNNGNGEVVEILEPAEKSGIDFSKHLKKNQPSELAADQINEGTIINNQEKQVETFKSSEALTDDQKIVAKKLVEENEVDKKKFMLFVRFQKESDPVKAIALFRRIDKVFKIEYFKTYYPEGMPAKTDVPGLLNAFEMFVGTDGWEKGVTQYMANLKGGGDITKVSLDEQKNLNTPPDSEIKTDTQSDGFDENSEDTQQIDRVLIDLAKVDSRDEALKIVRARWPDKPVNGTFETYKEFVDQAKRYLLLEGKNIEPDVPGLYKDKPEHVEPEEETTNNTPAEKDKRYFAVAGHPLVDEATKIKIVALKDKVSELDDAKNWFALVARFMSEDGKTSVATANAMSQEQGEFLNILLQQQIDGIPF